MADSISHHRIVPIMSPARLTSQPGGKGSEKQTGGAKMLQEDDLHIECLKERRLYAVPTPGDGECHCIALRGSWDNLANRCHIIKRQLPFLLPFRPALRSPGPARRNPGTAGRAHPHKRGILCAVCAGCRRGEESSQASSGCPVQITVIQ